MFWFLYLLFQSILINKKKKKLECPGLANQRPYRLIVLYLYLDLPEQKLQNRPCAVGPLSLSTHLNPNPKNGNKRQRRIRSIYHDGEFARFDMEGSATTGQAPGISVA